MSPATRCCVSPLMLLLKGESGAAGVVSPDDPEMMQAALSLGSWGHHEETTPETPRLIIWQLPLPRLVLDQHQP